MRTDLTESGFIPGILRVHCRCGVRILLAAVMLPGSPLHAQTKPETLLINQHAIAVNSRTHRMYAVDEARDQVLVADCGSGQSASVRVGHEPDALAIDEATDRIYAVNAGGGSVSVIDGATNAVIATVPTDKRPYTIAVDSRLNRVYVSNTFSNLLTVIDGATNTAKNLPLGSQDALAVDTVRHKVVMFGYESPTIKVLDEATLQVTTLKAAPHLWGIAVDERDGEFYVPEIGSNALFVSGKTPIAVGDLPDAVANDPTHDRIFVANYGNGATASTVSEMDAMQGKVMATIPVGVRPQAVAIDVQRGIVYVANTHSNNVTVIDEASGKVIATLPAGQNPYALALDPASGVVFAANYGAHPFTRLHSLWLLNKKTAATQSIEKGSTGE
jgi:YVTN family beta-propeller protein